MKYTIRNEEVSLTVDTLAAEIASFKKNNDNYEYMYDGNPKYWKGRNPILFPQISSTKDKVNTIYGHNYPMGNHGFARNSEFTLVKQSDNELTFVLKDNEDTYKQYPFYFELYVTYTLINNRVNIAYKVVNKDLKTMPFGFGLHPAFNCDNNYKDTYIVYDNNDKLEINEELFKQYPTYIYNPNPYKEATLYTNDHCLKLTFNDFKILALWSPFAPFICIEPWMVKGVSDDLAFEDRDDYIMLEPKEEEGSSFEISYSISLL